MINRNKYLGILVMMALLFTIFMFSVIVNEKGSDYDVNEYVLEERPSGAERWRAAEAGTMVLYIGGQNAGQKSVVSQWCCYTKQELVCLESVAEYEALQDRRQPAMVLLDGEGVQLSADCRELNGFIEQKIPLIFLTLPAPETISGSKRLREILGIARVEESSTAIQGVCLFDGFFLGGAATYQAETEKEEARQDMELMVPWYIMQSGTKTYMVGLMEEKAVKKSLQLEETENAGNYFPSLIWRNSCDGSRVFAVCGDYMSSAAGLGILDSFCYEMEPYAIYPVVNAQNILIQSFPNLSAENAATLMEIYSRSPQMYFQGVMWPGIEAMAKTNGYKLSCFINPQYDYRDAEYPRAEELPFYLRQLRQMNSEAGMAIAYDPEASFAEVLQADTEFYESLDSNYRYQSLFTEEKHLAELAVELETNSVLQKLVTIGTTYRDGAPLLDYLTDSVTLQRTTGEAKEHSYMDDFLVRGVETALLYSNVLIDLQDAVWPQNEEDEWQLLFDEIGSNAQTYWSPFKSYDKTTLSESDFRVRTLLNLDYSERREGSTIFLEVENVMDGAYFLLRTHEEKITGIRGGNYERLEKNVYLITAAEAAVEIDLAEISLEEQKKR